MNKKINSPKQILVIGGAGYIGSHIVYDLCDLNHNVTIFDNLSTGLKENIDPRSEFIKGDILKQSDLNNVFSNRNFDIVFHFAALKAAGESMLEPGKYANHNISGSINILNHMVEYKVQNIVFSSSAAVFGYPEYLPVDEEHPKHPINFYGFTKLEIERILDWYSKLKNIRFAALRYFNAAGYDVSGRIRGKEQNPANLLPIVMETAIGVRKEVLVFGDDYKTPDGTGIRDYIHVNDLSNAHILAMEYLEMKGDNLTINLGTGKGYSVLEVIQKAIAICDHQIPYKIIDRRAGDPAELIAVSKNASEILNWQAKYPDIETILKSMWEVYR